LGLPLTNDGVTAKYTIDARLEFLEKALGDATIKHVQWMDLANSAHSELANLHSRVTSETAAREDNHAALEDRITKEREHSKERVDYLEGMICEEHRRLWEAVDGHTHDFRSRHPHFDGRCSSTEEMADVDVDGAFGSLTPTIMHSAVVPEAKVTHDRPAGVHQPQAGATPTCDASPASENASRSTLSTAGMERGSSATPPLHYRAAPQGMQASRSQPTLMPLPPPQPQAFLVGQQQAASPPQQTRHLHLGMQPQPSQHLVQQHMVHAPRQSPPQQMMAAPRAASMGGFSFAATGPVAQHTAAGSSSRDIFSALDRDHDGVVTRAEWAMGLTGQPMPGAAKTLPPPVVGARPTTPLRTAPLPASRTPPPAQGRVQQVGPGREPIVPEQPRSLPHAAGGLIERV